MCSSEPQFLMLRIFAVFLDKRSSQLSVLIVRIRLAKAKGASLG